MAIGVEQIVWFAGVEVKFDGICPGEVGLHEIAVEADRLSENHIGQVVVVERRRPRDVLPLSLDVEIDVCAIFRDEVGVRNFLQVFGAYDYLYCIFEPPGPM